MPELPDVVVYVERLAAHLGGKVIREVRVASPFVVRTFDPPLSDLRGRRVIDTRRIGKRIVLGVEPDLFVVIHLMIAGRLRLEPPKVGIPKKLGLLAFDFDEASLLFTEAGSKKRASVHVVRGRDSLGAFDRGGIEPLDSDLEPFAEAIRRENRTLKRALTDPRLVSGIGNAYSDEILFRAGLSPVRLTSKLTDAELVRLFDATRETLTEWTERHRRAVGEGFPDKVTAFHEEMAVHGKYKTSCPRCGTAVQRIRYEANEVNYCPRCQTGGKVLADRSLSRLLKGDWPRSIEELEELDAKRRKEKRT